LIEVLIKLSIEIWSRLSGRLFHCAPNRQIEYVNHSVLCAEVFNTIEEKFVENVELNLVTSC